MAQLTDDCFAFSGPLLRLDDMERLIGERIAPVRETERVPLHGARARVAASDVKAPVDLPPFDNSAVDGYAVRHADLAADGDTTLEHRRPADRRRARRRGAQARRGDPHLHRRRHAEGRRHRLHAGGRQGRRRSRSWCRAA